MSSAQESVLSAERYDALNQRQQKFYESKINGFAHYLQTEGKDPIKSIGYAESSVPVRVARLQRVVEWYWNTEDIFTEFDTDKADRIVDALLTDEFRKTDGGRFVESSKRKFVDVLRNWFAYEDEDWEPEVRFTDNTAEENADPFTKSELRALTEAALEYDTIPLYKNLSPEERDRWKIHIAQKLRKPKAEVGPDDWEQINTSWKIPSLIRSTREAGWRPALVARMKTSWYDPDTQAIYIPKGEAVKNDAAWEQTLTDESALMFDGWLKQRANIELYDGRDEMWLNRNGNPYKSKSLNTILRNLMDEAGINPRGRKLVYYSFRHSIGTYVYDEYKDLKIVAEVLRQKSIASADRYVHPTRELRQEAASVM